MKRFLLFALGMMLLPAMALAQDEMDWQFSSIFPADSQSVIHQAFQTHGLAVDSTGNVWICGIGNPVYVFDADGTPIDFSPIETLTFGTETDTLSSCTGLRTDHQGNILASYGSTLYRINAETGEGMDKLKTGVMRNAETEASINTVGVTDDGFVVISYVFPNNPVQIWDPTLTSLVATPDDARYGFARTVAVSDDGTDIYQPVYSESAVLHYHSDAGVIGPYSVPDTLLRGIKAESIAFNHETGDLWLSSGSFNDFPSDPYKPFKWYAYDTETQALVDSVEWNNLEQDTSEALGDFTPRPRAIAFSPDGMTMYLGQFNGNPPVAGVQKFVFTTSDAVERPAGIPDALTLSQNYPNPFAVSTRIDFGVHKAGPVTLRVYDVLGREVRTLIDRVLPVGSNHSVTLEADDLPSGIYFYQLRTEGHQLSGKMLLVR